MEKKNLYLERAVFATKCMLAAYILTAGLLLLLAFLLFRFGLPRKAVSLCIIGIYIAVTFAAGFLAGRRAGRRKFLWGLAMGVAYYVILVVVSLIVNRGLQDVGSNMATVFFLCAGSGMLGGMVS